MTKILLSVNDLCVSFNKGALDVLHGVSFDLYEGKTLCLVGESGSGKSVTANALMDLLPEQTKISARHMTLDGHSLNDITRNKRDMAMIFQDPMTSLNPALTIGFQLREALKLKEKLSPRAVEARVMEVMQAVRIPDPEHRLQSYPHQLSGGMRQRIMIAMALIRRPRLLIADEPTTALDVTVQAQILWLLQTLQRETGTAILFITHDLGVVAEIADHVAVMYAGRIVEKAEVGVFFNRPAHPYSMGLMRATIDYRTACNTTFNTGEGKAQPLAELPGSVPSPSDRPSGCAFANRCEIALDSCTQQAPHWLDWSNNQGAACPVLYAHSHTPQGAPQGAPQHTPQGGGT